MKVFHGSLEEVTVPALNRCTHVGDFGVGFYVTTSLEQARRFVKTKARRVMADGGMVSCYELDERLFAAPFHGKVFDSPNCEWAEFVRRNRLDLGFSHAFDYVRGPVANDQVYASFSLFEAGLLSFDALLEQLKVHQLCDQIVFHTEAALRCLVFLHSEAVTW